MNSGLNGQNLNASCSTRYVEVECPRCGNRHRVDLGIRKEDDPGLWETSRKIADIMWCESCGCAEYFRKRNGRAGNPNRLELKGTKGKQ